MEIIRLTLLSGRLEEQKQFYVNRLRLPLLEEENTFFTVAAGETRLRFSFATDDSNPFYHFAFNIPENKIEEAREWLAERVKLSADDGETLIHFPHWNAHSLYFTDPAGNIVEFIARHNLQNQTDHPFDQNDILCVSEIGLPVDNVLDRVEELQVAMGLQPWRTPSDQFTPVGDEHGLLILVPVGRVWFMSEKSAQPFPLELTINGNAHFDVKMKQYMLRMRVRPHHAV
jgi:catechol-2,3-dioxygenase